MATARARQRARKPAAPSLSEAAFQQQVTDYATLCGWRWTHTPDSRRVQGQAGFPDLVLVRGGRLVFVELKTDKGRMRPEQVTWAADLLLVPYVEVFLWRPTDWLSIERTLR